LRGGHPGPVDQPRDVAHEDALLDRVVERHRQHRQHERDRARRQRATFGADPPAAGELPGHELVHISLGEPLELHVAEHFARRPERVAIVGPCCLADGAPTGEPLVEVLVEGHARGRHERATGPVGLDPGQLTLCFAVRVVGVRPLVAHRLRPAVTVQHRLTVDQARLAAHVDHEAVPHAPARLDDLPDRLMASLRGQREGEQE
jgi:hypothetical protein